MGNDKKDNLMDSDVWKIHEKMMHEKRKTMKKGENVIHLDYLGGILSKNDIETFENKLDSVGIELSHFDKSGVPYANLDSYNLVVFVAVSQPIIGELIKGISSNATWDALKFILLSLWSKLKNKFYFKATSQNTERKEISFGLKVQLDKNTSFNFSLDGNVDKSIIDSSLDKVLNFLGEQKGHETYKNTDYVYYDKSKGKWIKVDVENEIKKLIKKGKIKNK